MKVSINAYKNHKYLEGQMELSQILFLLLYLKVKNVEKG